MTTHPQRQCKYYELVMAAFVADYLCSNLIGPANTAQLTLKWFGHVTFGAGVPFSPIFYIFGDILTEVYSDRDTDFTPFSLKS